MNKYRVLLLLLSFYSCNLIEVTTEDSIAFSVPKDQLKTIHKQSTNLIQSINFDSINKSILEQHQGKDSNLFKNITINCAKEFDLSSTKDPTLKIEIIAYTSTSNIDFSKLIIQRYKTIIFEKLERKNFFKLKNIQPKK